MTTWLVRLDPDHGATGPRLAVKDLIDVAGTPTTCASAPVAATAGPATEDAAVVVSARAQGARIVGKTNLHELAFGGSGVNAFTGTPMNPLDPTRVPGGSSSGSAVAVATGEADVALGTDTGGSVRTPSACCGTVGLKTTFGRISLAGVRPLAPSLDTVGPMAADVAGVATGMALLEPGFTPAHEAAPALGRYRVDGVRPDIEAAINRLLATAGIPVADADLPSWDLADEAGTTVAFAEAARVHARLLADHGAELGADVRTRLELGTALDEGEYLAAQAIADPWRHELDLALARHPVIVLAALVDEPPTIAEAHLVNTRRCNVAVNLAGHPALVLPVPGVLVGPGRLPTSVQLVGPHGGEELLIATAAVLERAARSHG